MNCWGSMAWMSFSFIYFGVPCGRKSTLEPNNAAQLFNPVGISHLILQICSF